MCSAQYVCMHQYVHETSHLYKVSIMNINRNVNIIYIYYCIKTEQINRLDTNIHNIEYKEDYMMGYGISLTTPGGSRHVRIHNNQA